MQKYRIRIRNPAQCTQMALGWRGRGAGEILHQTCLAPPRLLLCSSEEVEQTLAFIVPSTLTIYSDTSWIRCSFFTNTYYDYIAQAFISLGANCCYTEQMFKSIFQFSAWYFASYNSERISPFIPIVSTETTTTKNFKSHKKCFSVLLLNACMARWIFK